MRDFRFQKDVWSLLIVEEELKCLHEKEKENYKFAIAVYINELCHKLVLGYGPFVLGHVRSVFQFSTGTQPNTKYTQDVN